ncbi:hypothetical protein [Photobacterium phosphoreum]|uniref:hypothetical protein n=1 Tax=Photobacterium phosphoreum TaxID=659 RepID=UPI000D158754|nr:hypothetical protein [Photobacterium phosphoreum]PTB31100.1 hypothetical protein DAT36_18785 [Photobacterium phosphoreum]
MGYDFESHLVGLKYSIDNCFSVFAKIDIANSLPLELSRKYEAGRLTQQDLDSEFETRVAINSGLALLSILEKQEEHFNNYDDLSAIFYFKALLLNLNALFILYNDEENSGFYGFGFGYETDLSAEDFNRLASKDITKPTLLMSNQYFEDELVISKDSYQVEIDKDKAKQWLKDRRYFKPIIENKVIESGASSIVLSQHDPIKSIRKYIDKVVQELKKENEFNKLIGSQNGFFNVLNNNASLLTLSEILKLDLIVFCSKVNDAKEIIKEKENEKKIKAELLTNEKSISYLTVAQYITEQGGQSHPTLSETKYIKPMIINGHVIAVEKTKKVNIWFQQSYFNLDLWLGDIIEYKKVSPDAIPYGRNSNLKKIPELAYDDLYKVKIKQGNELIEFISFLMK